ncbi:MAG: dTDP-4-dehydrorhamnose 3,5-epimerase [Velocimicrobium sp.]
MNITDLEFDGVKIIEPTYFEDYRGYYCETYSERTLKKELGVDTVFVQDNHFLSLKRGTIRGIHFQNNPKAQTKLLRCTRGSLLDVVVDLRRGSDTFGKWISVILTAENRKQIYIPQGYGHACISLEDNTEGQYKVDALYEPTLDRAIAWNDPFINIEWTINNKDIIVSDKDKKAPTLAESDVNFIL